MAGSRLRAKMGPSGESVGCAVGPAAAKVMLKILSKTHSACFGPPRPRTSPSRSAR